jgi:hypothetical protein
VHKTGSEAIKQSQEVERAAADRIEAAAKRLEQISRLARQG